MATVDPSELQSWLEAEAEALRAELARLVEDRPNANAEAEPATRSSSMVQGGEAGSHGAAASLAGASADGSESVASEVRSVLRELERQTRLGEEGVKLLTSLQEKLQGGVIRFES